MGVDLARPNSDAPVLTPNTTDPLGSMLAATQVVSRPPVRSNSNFNIIAGEDYALDHIITECKHPGIQIVRFPNGDRKLMAI
jgi:hypothetical protein